MNRIPIITAILTGLLLLLPAASHAQDYPPTSGGISVACSFDGTTVSCSGRGFEPSSTVTARVFAAGSTTARRTDTLTANASGEVLHRFQPQCDVNSIQVEMSGTDANGSAGSARATVDISNCQGATPQTGGGAALLGLVALGGFTALARRRR